MTDLSEEILEASKDSARPRVEPGFYQDMPNELYHGSQGTSSSQLKKLVTQTPAHLKASWSEPSKSTPAMAMGTAVHSLVLEPEKFGDDVIVSPVFNKRTKAGKSEFEAFEREAAGRTIITAEQYATAQTMAEKVRGHSLASNLLQDVIVESSVFQWYESMDPDDQTQYRELIKVRPDAASRAYPVLVDLKTTDDASYSAFQRTILNFYYHLSAAMYLEVCNNNHKILNTCGHGAFTKFIFVVVENKPPHEVAVYELAPEFRDLGKTIFRRAMLDLNRGRSQDWPGYPMEIRVMDPPTWASRAYII